MSFADDIDIDEAAWRAGFAGSGGVAQLGAVQHGRNLTITSGKAAVFDDQPCDALQLSPQTCSECSPAHPAW